MKSIAGLEVDDVNLGELNYTGRTLRQMSCEVILTCIELAHRWAYVKKSNHSVCLPLTSSGITS